MMCASCPPGTIDQAGACVKPPVCPAAGTLKSPSSGNLYGQDYTSAPVGKPLFCIDGCVYKLVNGFSGPTSTGWYASASIVESTGASCSNTSTTSPTTPLKVPAESGGDPVNPEDCPPGTGYAEVNGKKSCLPSGTTGTGKTTSTTDTSGNTSGSSEDWTINGDGTVTRKTTNTISGPGGSGTSTTTETGGTGEPGKDGNDGKDVDFGPAPSFGEPSSEGFDPDLAAGTPLPVFSPDTSLLAAGSGSCPPPIGFNVMGMDFSIGFEPLCDWAGFFRAFLLIVSSFAALRILVMA